MSDNFRLSGRVEVDAKQAVASLDAATGGVEKVAASTKKMADGASASAGAATKAAGAAKQLGTAAAQAGDAIDTQTAALRGATAATDAKAAADRRATASAGQMRAGTQQLGMQFGDFTQQLSLGINPVIAFAQQAGQAAYAMSMMGGTAKTVGTFFAGPYGAILLAAGTVTATLAGQLFLTGENAKGAADGLKEFERRQSDLANFIDRTTGALIENNEALRANFALREKAKIEANDATIKANRAVISGVINRVGVTGSTFRAERQASAPTFDPAIMAVLAKAKGDVEKIDAGFRALGKSRPELKAAIVEISNATAAIVIAQRENKASAASIDVVTGKTIGQAKASASLIEKQVALATATTPLEKARAAYNLVLERGQAAEKQGGAALVQYRADLTGATTAVKAAETAEQAARETRRSTTKETRDAAKEARAFASDLAEIEGRFVAGAKAAAVYAGQMATLRKQFGGEIPIEQRAGVFGEYFGSAIGLDGDVAAEKLRTPRASRQASIDADRAIKDRAGQFADYLEIEVPEVGGALGKATADRFRADGLQAAQAIGQIIGGATGGKIASALSLVNGGGLGAGIKSILGKDTTAGQSFSTALKDTFKPLTGKFDKLLDGKFGEKLGQAGAGAAKGAAVAGIGNALGVKMSGTGASIGGALGGLTMIPGADIAGAVLGGLIGNALKTTKKGASTISASDGAVNVGQATGNSAAFRKAADAMGNSVGDAISALVSQLGGDVGQFAVSIGKRGDNFTVDTAGQGRTKKVAKYATEGEATQAALADAIRDGGVGGVSPRVQAVLQQYAENVNKAVAEALKVKGLEDLLANEDNPFSTAFRDFEAQAKQRVDVARQYGFEVIEIEKINGRDRAKLVRQVLDQATSSVKAVLDELRFGAGAEGSFDQRRTAIVGERDRLADLARGGDQDALNRLAQVSQQLLALDKEGGGATALYAADRAQTVSLLDSLVRQTEDRINAAAAAATTSADKTAAQLAEANATLDDQVALQQRMLEAIDGLPAQIAQAVAAFSAGGSAALAYTRNSAQ